MNPTGTFADPLESDQLSSGDSDTTPAPASSRRPSTPPLFDRIPDLALVFLALFAFAWAVARACIQAVTGDEGETYNVWVATPDVTHWYPASNNHVLNSLLIRMFTSVFPLSPLSLRLPSLLGAALYIAIAYWLTKFLTRNWAVRFPLFICLVYNPFVFDFFVAARGYGLATAFLLAAIALPAWCYFEWPNRPKTLIVASALSSLSIVLSLTANFSFAFIDFFVYLLLTAAALLRARQSTDAGRKLYTQVLAACVLPGFLILLFLPSWTLLHWRAGQLFDGGTSLKETLHTVVEASLFRLNPLVANPIIYSALDAIKRFLIPAAGELALLQLVLLLIAFKRGAFKRAGHRRDERTLGLFALTALCLGALVLALLAHQLGYALFRVLIPRHRTAVFIAPLVTLAIGAIASIRPPSLPGRLTRYALLTVLSVTAVYFLMCSRLTYFREWQYQEDVKRGYDVMSWYIHNRNVHDVEVTWWYYGALHFYQYVTGDQDTASLNNTGSADHPLDKQLYVLNNTFDGHFIGANKMKILYHGPRTDLVVAVLPNSPLAGQ